jgi:hypothetical protein
MRAKVALKEQIKKLHFQKIPTTKASASFNSEPLNNFKFIAVHRINPNQINETESKITNFGIISISYFLRRNVFL